MDTDTLTISADGNEAIIDIAAVQEKKEIEAKSKDPRLNSPSENSSRFHEVYGKMKQLERDLQQVREGGIKEDKLVQQLIEQNKNLTEAIKKQANPISNQPSIIEVKESRINELLDLRKAARKDLDHAQVDEINDEISAIKFELIDLKRQTKEEINHQESNHQVDVDPAISEFAKSTSWFETDSVMRAAAIAIDDELLTQPKWKAVPTNERLKEVARLTEERFNVNRTTRSTVGGVESGGTGRFRHPSGSVKLEKAEIELAKGFGISLEDIAIQKRFLGER